MLTFDAAPDELQLFLQEADEQLQLLDQDIVLLEKEGPRPELLQEIFRAAHTLKGSSAAIGHKRMAALTHAMENVLDQLRQGRAECTTGLIDILLESLDGLRLLKVEVETLEEGDFDPVDLVENLHSVISSPADLSPESLPADTGPSETEHLRPVDAGSDEDLRVVVKIAEDCPLSAARLLQAYLEASSFGHVVFSDPSLESIEKMEVGHQLELMLRVNQDGDGLVKALEALPDVVEVKVGFEEAITSVDSSGNPIEAPNPSNGPTASPSAASVKNKGAAKAAGQRSNGNSGGSLGKTVRIDVSRLDNLLNLVGELVIDRTRLTQLGGQLQNKYDDEAIGDLTDTTLHIGRIVDELQESIMKARMLPVESLFNRLPRVVRDLAQRIGKKVDFVIEGKETELDRSVIEELHDPLVHLLRNCVDHGIEPSRTRLASGKAEVGTVKLSAMHRENRILIRVEDDGSGIDAAKVRATAIKRGILTQEAADRMTDQEALELIFAPGFSTAEIVSDVSGRGVGMDIVRTNIEKLNGSVSVETWPGKGTRFTLELPLTLAIIDALMVGLGDEILAIPLVSVVETLRVTKSEIQCINRRRAIQLRHRVLPLVELDLALGLPSKGSKTDRVFVVAVRVGENRFGLIVDSLLGELQVVIKSLGRQVGNIAGVTGATILGDGRVALILDVPSLIKCVLDEQSKGWAA